MCLFPIKAWKVVSVDTGESHVVFRQPKRPFHSEEISLPCGKCIECLTQYSNEWANRCMLEASLHQHNCMITLTFSVSDGSVHKSDLQLFLKRLRKRLDVHIRFFECGEYGKRGSRPHYHIIIFGWRPDDLVQFFYRDDHWVYLSDFVASVWQSGDCWKSLVRQPGFITVEDLTWRSAKYCAKYLQKMQTLLPNQNPPFTQMSLRPGIGLGAFKSEWLDSDHLYIGGSTYPIPRYFRRKYPGDYSIQSERRLLRGKLYNSTLEARRKSLKSKFGVLRV